MKAVTEFHTHLLQKVLAAKTTLAGEGKSPEEISQSVGESFKLEGDRLKHILNASDLIKDKASVRRVLVVSFAEGETVPPKAQKVDESYYMVEILEIRPAAEPAAAGDRKGGRKGGPGGGRGAGGPKSSPWGMSPEEKAAKNKGGAKAPKPS